MALGRIGRGSRTSARTRRGEASKSRRGLPINTNGERARGEGTGLVAPYASSSPPSRDNGRNVTQINSSSFPSKLQGGHSLETESAINVGHGALHLLPPQASSQATSNIEWQSPHQPPTSRHLQWLCGQGRVWRTSKGVHKNGLNVNQFDLRRVLSRSKGGNQVGVFFGRLAEIRVQSPAVCPFPIRKPS